MLIGSEGVIHVARNCHIQQMDNMLTILSSSRLNMYNLLISSPLDYPEMAAKKDCTCGITPRKIVLSDCIGTIDNQAVL